MTPGVGLPVEARKRPWLLAKYSSAGLEEVPLLYLGEEEDFYEGEIRDMVLSVLTEALASLGFEITEAGKHYKTTYRGDQGDIADLFN